MSSSNADYFARRAQQERVAADAASDPHVAAVHREMADMYDIAAKVASGAGAPPIHLFASQATA